MKAHLVQFDIAWENPAANFAKVRRMLEAADVQPGDLILLPEMFDTGFSTETGKTIDKDGRTLASMAEMAREYDAYVQGGRTVAVQGHGVRRDVGRAEGAEEHASERRATPGGPAAHNVMTVVAPDGQIVDEYAKIKLFPLGKEAERITAGNKVTTWHWETQAGALHVCPLVCYDLRFPELFRDGLRQGSEVYAIGACWLQGRHAHWKPLLIARAIENQAFVLGVNRVGSDPNSKYLGGTIAVGPKGEVLGELAEEEAVLSVEIDPRDVRRWRDVFPAWKEAMSEATA